MITPIRRCLSLANLARASRPILSLPARLHRLISMTSPIRLRPVPSLIAGLFGLLLSVPLVSGLGGWLEENMGQFFPQFRMSPLTAVAAVTLTLGLGALASLIPAIRAGRMPVTDALRRIA